MVNRGVSRRDALKTFATAAGGAALVPAVDAMGAGAATNTGHPRLSGRVVTPADPDYESARRLWDGLFDSRPRVLVFCDKAKDAENAVAWARRHDVPIRARSGRHSLEGWSGVDGGITIDVSALKSVSVDHSRGTATVGTGNTQAEVVTSLGRHGLTVPTGSEASVGIAGVTLGGGIGFLSRSLGVTCDSLVALDLVVPHGRKGARLLKVDEQHHPDLLWASRGGGGGNFGVATSFTFRTHSVPTASLCELHWQWAEWEAAFNTWQGWATTVDHRFGSTFEVLGKQADFAALKGVFTGSERELRALLAPMLAIGSPKVTTKSGSYIDVFNYFNQGGRTTANWKFSSSWASRPLDPTAVGVVNEFVEKAPAPLCNFWCLSFGGATTVPPPGGAAWFHRDPLYYAEPGAGWNDPSLTPACESWVAELRAALDPYVEGGYVNVPDPSFSDWGTAYYGADNFNRLRQIKATYDPENVFNFPQSIPVGV